MSRIPQNIQELLLDSGKDQFLKHGFEKASLRTICKQAGLTTGAFYTHFPGKEELFSALVDPLVNELQNVILQEPDLRTGTDHELKSIAYAITHKDEFRLLFECSKGTKYEGFKDHLINEVLYPDFKAFFNRNAGGHVDPALVRILFNMKLEAYKELIYGGYTMEEAEKLITRLSEFSEAGFHRLIEEVNQEC